jgi:transcription-repair coupling factor (superfamily II helicase)
MESAVTHSIARTPAPAEPRLFSAKIEGLLEKARQAGKGPLLLEGLVGSARGLFLAQIIKSAKRPIVLLTRDQVGGETLLGDIRYFLRHLKSSKTAHFFPAWELLPYEPLSPLPEISGERLDILHRLTQGEPLALIVPMESAMQRVMPRKVLSQLTYTLCKSDTVERDFLEVCLLDNGFARTPLVEGRGEFSLRGDILDVFPSYLPDPVRIELFGDTVESLRSFDIVSQSSIGKVAELKILPVRELCLNQAQIESGLRAIEAIGGERGVEKYRLQELMDRIQHLRNFSGIESLAPFFYGDMETLFDYLPDEALLVLDEEEILLGKAEEYHLLIEEEHGKAWERGDVAVDPAALYLTVDVLQSAWRDRQRLVLSALKLTSGDDAEKFHTRPTPVFHGKFDAFAEQVMQWRDEGISVAVVAPTKGQVRRVNELAGDLELPVAVEMGLLSNGFSLAEHPEAFVAEHEIFGRTHKHRHRRRPRSMSFQRGFKDLKPGDFLVHIDYGIGKYMGMRELQTGVGGGEFLEILFVDDEKLYIPMDGLALIQKYMGSGEVAPPLSKLGGVAWKRQKNKVKESIREMAEELLKLYAQRELAEGVAYSHNPVLVQEFADTFEYAETEDQLKAIDDVLEDLEKSKPMDRLVCGDVGYGKTEVAMRAAFKVVLDKRQVAVLVPTTILAQQHLNTFRERFRAYPVNIDLVNRFRTPKEQKRTLERLRRGEIDIIIGTHRLLSKDVRFADLGLIVIDEEQRFGVGHKEKLKQLRASVDILTLTATPIPRTLHFSLMGIRDLSVIETPPVDRLAIKTFIRKFDESIVREAILRELDRGGQVYFVHNKVVSIRSVADMIQRIVPGLRIGIAHGQLPEHQLEKVMTQFIEKEIDLLLCTTIIESGLDIPTANTIIINRADQFGLAQLYQLRGRVGRYKHQAYAYLLVPGMLAISDESRQRLSAIEGMSELGSGFQLAARDMEIRGVGNMLGHNQSGHISSIGFDLYTQLIEETVREMRGQKVEHFADPELDFRIKGFIPKTYVPDLNQRLEAYRRFQMVIDIVDLEAMEKELCDRYGAIPEAVEKLTALLRIKILCRGLHISRAAIKNDIVHLKIESTTPIPADGILRILDRKMRLAAEDRLEITLDKGGWKRDTDLVLGYLRKLNALCPVDEKN